MKNFEKNLAFIDGQNLYLGTMSNNWKIDLDKFRVYLKDKYQVTIAYYFLGYFSVEQESLYLNLKKAGFTVLFKEHDSNSLATKKGNVDTDIVFEAMKNLVDNEGFDRMILVSGDGDYKKLVDYLIKKNRFKKIFFPNKKFSSSLYKNLGNEYFVNLENEDIRHKIEYLKI